MGPPAANQLQETSKCSWSPSCVPKVSSVCLHLTTLFLDSVVPRTTDFYGLFHKHTIWVGLLSVILQFIKGDILRIQHSSWDLSFGSLVPPHAYKLWKKSVEDYLSEICISESTWPTVTKRVSQFGAPSYVGRGHIWILPPTFPPPSKQSMAKILWTSRWALGGGVHAFQKQGYSIR